MPRRSMENTPTGPGPDGHEGLGHAGNSRMEEMIRRNLSSQGPGPDGHEAQSQEGMMPMKAVGWRDPLKMKTSTGGQAGTG